MLVPVSAQDFNINIYAERLDDAADSPMALDGLVLVVASTEGEDFAPPTPASFVQGDDIILGKFSLDSGFGAGVFDRNLSGNFTGSLSAGDPLRLYWFPSLTVSATEPGADALYGTYRSDSPEEENLSPWRMPAGASLVSIAFFTADAVGGGPNSALAGNALTPVPEPSTYAAVFGLACLGWAVAKRKFKAAPTAVA
jgi:hypothetical protein